MGIRQNIEHTKTLLNQGVDLLLLRMQILNLDLAEQAENVFRIIIWLVVSGILLLIAFISLDLASEADLASGLTSEAV